MKKFHFAGGSADGPRSTVWRLWTSRNEFYLQSLMMGGSAKVSIHSGGAAQYSLQSEWYAKHHPNQPNQGRHFDKWRWTEPTESVASILFRMCIPDSELRIFHDATDLSLVTWIDQPGVDRQVQIVCYMSPASADEAPTNEAGFLCALDRDSGSVVVFFYTVIVSSEDLLQLELVNSQVKVFALQNGKEIQNEHRLALFASNARYNGILWMRGS